MPTPKAQFSHVGFLVRDAERMIDFYSRVMGLVLTDRGPYRLGGEIIFLSGTTSEHHQVVFVTGRKDDAHSSILNQLSFHVDTLEQVCQQYKLLVSVQAKELQPRCHGNAWSLYFHDPDGNRCELYTPSPWYVNQPFGEPWDPTEPIATIMAKTEALVRKSPGFTTREAWEAQMAARLAAH